MRFSFRKLQQRYIALKYLRRLKDEKKGFEWACPQLLYDRLPVEYLESYLFNSSDAHFLSPGFKEGAHQALTKLEHYCPSLLLYNNPSRGNTQ